jgi:hypothetical protein
MTNKKSKKMEIMKPAGKPACAKASADNRAHRSFNAGGASWLTTKTTGEPSWFTARLEASPVIFL